MAWFWLAAGVRLSSMVGAMTAEARRELIGPAAPVRT